MQLTFLKKITELRRGKNPTINILVFDIACLPAIPRIFIYVFKLVNVDRLFAKVNVL